MEPLLPDKLKTLMDNPLAPSDYVDWLHRNGWGSVSNDRYMLYDGLIALEEVVPDAPPGFLTFGDDMAGCNGCFSIDNDGVVYEYISDNGEVCSTGKQFSDFIKTYA
jgi:hypothetical protein